jgi:Outer membrane protein beta-barrel domain
MRKINMVILASILFSASSFAQKGNNQIGVGGDLSIPSGDFASYFKTGVGVYVKGMLGVGKSGQVTFTTGYSSFKSAGDWTDANVIQTVVPFVFGYRANFNGFFIEPQIGYGAYTEKYPDGDGISTDGGGAFTWAAGIGYVFNKKIEVSARYQSASKDGSSVNMFGLRLGYNFSLNTSKK